MVFIPLGECSAVDIVGKDVRYLIIPNLVHLRKLSVSLSYVRSINASVDGDGKQREKRASKNKMNGCPASRKIVLCGSTNRCRQVIIIDA